PAAAALIVDNAGDVIERLGTGADALSGEHETIARATLERSGGLLSSAGGGERIVGYAPIDEHRLLIASWPIARGVADQLASALRWLVPAFALALALAAWAARRLARPAIDAAAAAARIAAGDPAPHLPERGPAEWADLARAINRLGRWRAQAGELLADRDGRIGVTQLLSRDVYWEQDARGVFTRIDDGASASPLRGKLGRSRWDDAAVRLDGGSWDTHREALERREPFVELAYSWIDSTGRTFFCVDSGIPRLAADGSFAGYAGVSREASAETLNERARRLAIAALRASTEPVLWIEARPRSEHGWRVIWANAAACALLDRSESEAMAMAPGALLAPDSTALAATISEALQQRREWRGEAGIARRWGEQRQVEIRLEPLPAGAGAQSASAALLLRDRSAERERARLDSQALVELRRRMRERSLELEVTARELESFAYTVSHDLRAPIRVVEGFARMLQEDGAAQLDRIGHEHLQRILGAAARMNEMIDALLSLSRISGQPIVAEPVDLSRTADLIAEELKAREPQRNVVIRVQPQLKARGDRMLLRLVLENLIGNAWKYSSKREQSQIDFFVSSSDPVTVYCIRDNGEGFDMRFADRLFGVFQRLHSASEFPGTGVGLATVQRIVRRHGGRVWADAQPGAGARFFFTLWEKSAASAPTSEDPR
ncbi:MAG TPA: ATP-binding protein, partial [Burkholderiaceae bacterium]|nr:ATP-binding protein [Burkholderiaceae bacterium]